MPDLADLRVRVDAALQGSMDRCARCKACDVQVDAVMSVLAAALEPPAAVEWGIVRPEGMSGSGDVWGCGRWAETYVRHLLRQHRSIHGDSAGWLVTRDIGQWKKVQDD